MTQEEWLTRYKKRFMERADLTERQAQACANAEDFLILSDGREDDPEMAADDEMDCWDDDGHEGGGEKP